MKGRLSRIRFSLLFALPFVVTIGVVTGILMGAPLVVIPISLVFVALFWYGYTTVPFEFELYPDGFILFRSVARSLRVPINEVVEIYARPWNSGFVFFRYNRRKVALFRNTPGMKELIQSIQTRNPSTIVKGGV